VVLGAGPKGLGPWGWGIGQWGMGHGEALVVQKCLSPGALQEQAVGCRNATKNYW